MLYYIVDKLSIFHLPQRELSSLFGWQWAIGYSHIYTMLYNRIMVLYWYYIFILILGPEQPAHFIRSISFNVIASSYIPKRIYLFLKHLFSVSTSLSSFSKTSLNHHPLIHHPHAGVFTYLYIRKN